MILDVFEKNISLLIVKFFGEKFIGSDLIVNIYLLEEDRYINEVYSFDCWENMAYLWLNDWYEGQIHEIIGFTPVELVKVPANFRRC